MARFAQSPPRRFLGLLPRVQRPRQHGSTARLSRESAVRAIPAMAVHPRVPRVRRLCSRLRVRAELLQPGRTSRSFASRYGLVRQSSVPSLRSGTASRGDRVPELCHEETVPRVHGDDSHSYCHADDASAMSSGGRASAISRRPCRAQLGRHGNHRPRGSGMVDPAQEQRSFPEQLCDPCCGG
jgi:hypothetical protein